MNLSVLNFLALAVFLFVSCEKGTNVDKVSDEKEDTEIKDDGEKDHWGDKDEKDCFELVYPVTYTMPDGSEISGGPEELEAAIKEWYETHDSAEKPVLNFPVQIVYPDNDEAVTINNEEELEAAKEDC